MGGPEGRGLGWGVLRDGVLCVGTGPPILNQCFYPLSPRASISRDPFYDMLATRKRRIANKK